MGRVRTKLIKRAARITIEKYYAKLTMDFDTNKKIVEEVAIVPSKRLRNQIAGFITHLMKRIHRGGSVRGISLKLQEEERERRLDYVPEKSSFEVDTVEVDADTADLLKAIDFGDLAGIQVQSAAAPNPHQRRDRNNKKGDRKERGERGERKPRPAKAENAPAAAQ